MAAWLALACNYGLDSFYRKCHAFFLENLHTLSRSTKESEALLQSQLTDGMEALQLAELLVSVLGAVEEHIPTPPPRAFACY